MSSAAGTGLPGGPPRPDASLRLVPPGRGGRRGALRIALLTAFGLHVLLGAVITLRLPALLRAAPAPPPREASVEIVQNSVAATGDAPVGGNGRITARQTPTPPPAEAAAPKLPPPGGDDLLTANGEVAAAPRFAPLDQSGTPAPRTPPPSRTAPAPPQPPAVRIDGNGDDDGMTGGTEDAPAAPDPKARNQLPPYPTQAAEAHEQGTVTAVVNVTPDGNAASVIVVQSSGSPVLDSAAVRAWQRWRFRPATDHGTKVSSQVPVTLRFVLRTPGAG